MNKTKRYEFRADEEFSRNLEYTAKKNKTTVSAYIRTCVTAGLEPAPPAEPKKRTFLDDLEDAKVRLAKEAEDRHQEDDFAKTVT